MSGVVNRVNVAPGQTIAENELIMVIEAMKMETNVTAPRSGIVKIVQSGGGRFRQGKSDRCRTRIAGLLDGPMREAPSEPVSAAVKVCERLNSMLAVCLHK